MTNGSTSGSETGRDARWWVAGGALLIVVAIVLLIAGWTITAVAFFAIGGMMIALSRSLALAATSPPPHDLVE